MESNTRLSTGRVVYGAKSDVSVNTSRSEAVASNRFAGGLLGGWSISGIVILQSGAPMTLIDRSGGSVYGFAAPATVTHFAQARDIKIW